MIIGFDGSRAFVKNEQSSRGDHGRTGTENYSYQLLKHLSLIDKKNIYQIYLRPNSLVDHHDWPENFKFKVINFPRLWTQAGLALETFINPPDILFVPAHTLPILRKPAIKTVMTVHDLGSEYLPSAHQFKQKLYLKLTTDLLMNSATKLIAVSNSTKNDLISQAKVGKSQVEVIYEGVDKTVFQPIPYVSLKEVLYKYDLVKNYYFLTVGTIQPRKNLIRLMKAFKGFLNMTNDFKFKLILVGEKGWLSDEIFEVPKKIGLNSNVRFLGRVKDEELVHLYSGAAALVYPSLYEGFGLPVLEAFACNCPVIASNSSSLPEVVGEAGLLVNPYSVEQIMAAMLKLTSNQNLRDNLIEEGSIRASKFTWDECAKKTLALIENL